MAKKLLVLTMVAVMLVAGSAPAWAARVLHSTNINIPASETINETVFAAGSQVVVDGKIDGDLFVAGENVILNGEVTGDIIGASNQFTQNGKIGGNLRFAASSAILNSEVGKNITLAAGSVVANEKSKTGQDMLFASGNALFKGLIGRDIIGGGDNVTFSGPVGGKVELYGVNYLTVDSKADIKGELVYHGPRKGVISEGAKIGGGARYIYRPTERKNRAAHWLPAVIAGKAFHTVFSFLALLLVWFILKTFFPGFLEKLTGSLRENPAETFGWGLLALIATPVIAILLMITLIGLPVGIAAMALYAAAIYLGTLITALYLAEWLRKKWDWQNNVFWAFFIVALVIKVVTAIPFVHMLAGFVMACWGLGSMAQYLKGLRTGSAAL